MKDIQELNNQLAKHRKLLHRAVGNKILPHINYHHYEIVRLIGEIDNIILNERINKFPTGLWGVNPVLEASLQEFFTEKQMESEDKYILTGKFDNFTTDSNGNHSDTHISS